jgi:hypothetical protein
MKQRKLFLFSKTYFLIGFFLKGLIETHQVQHEPGPKMDNIQTPSEKRFIRLYIHRALRWRLENQKFAPDSKFRSLEEASDHKEAFYFTIARRL